MKLITEVVLPEYSFKLEHQTPALLMGSCFTENIGRQLERYRFPVSINPFGVNYNPLSIEKGLEVLMSKKAYGEEDLHFHNNLWFSFDHYTGFSSPDQEKALAGINRSLESARMLMKQAGVLIITWGTSWVYSYNRTGQVVCNCHKIPAKEFTRSQLSPNEIVAAYQSLLPKLLEFNHKLRILYTISPVRHWKDGAHGNQLSKAALLLAGDALEKSFPDRFSYFPAYEILMDELRDYRFYADDMLHTSDRSTLYIWEKFREVLISDASDKVIRELEPILKLQEHRPMNTDNPAYQKMQDKLHEMIRKFKIRYSDIDI
jgi:hypothetical protein